ncbi:LysR family transcriptional regulator [Aestuariispira insulae]|uniref:DNA-binding transcriptional LysR family regulator n=1 Tax=Aestuariispira insulae TaxID=1461337 RepID=A0A3D9HPD1_9PROT|nr:LysR family transcriptional regulator [Aestuariispira insulae]RED51340.1 DNA-binding transcriptional LysR family regulator [Aestuariispira insulae]
MRRSFDRHHLMTVFQSVARQGSFSRAARHLGLPVSSVSKSVTSLEDSLGIKLIYRTTRHLSLTDEGQRYLGKVDQILNLIDDADDEVRGSQGQPAGRLRIVAPTIWGQFRLAPALSRFMMLYPDIKPELWLEDRTLDLAEEGIDVAFRPKLTPADQDHFCRPLPPSRQRLVASPGYIAGNPMPLATPEDLLHHRTLSYQGHDRVAPWQFWDDEGNSHSIKTDPVLGSNNYGVVLQAALDGVGIARLYDYITEKALDRGELIPLLTKYQQPERDRYLVYQQRRVGSAKLAAFLDFIETELGTKTAYGAG